VGRHDIADFRREREFLTLDFSDGDKPLLYQGHAVTLPELKFQLLRDDEQIKASAGKYRGKVDLLQCPSCGSSIRYIPGLAANCICPSCSTRLDASSPRAEVLLKGEQSARVPFTLTLGAIAKIGAHDYRVLGVMRRASDEGEAWNEYLLYSTQGPFFWLVETDEGWSRSDVMDDWPTPALPAMRAVRVDNTEYTRTWEYGARVLYAAGAFNWRVAAGDVVKVVEYEHGQHGLAAEFTAGELTWSRSAPVAWDQVRAWFKLDSVKPSKGPKAPASGRDIAWKTLVWIFCLNFIPLVFNFGATVAWMLVGTVALFLPLLIAPEK
jgi:hypothetical protein